MSASPQSDRGCDVTSVARGAACPFCRRQISRPECQRVIGGRRGGDAKPNQRLALRHDHLAISLCQANRDLRRAARCPRRRWRRRRADKSWSGGHDLFDRIHEKRSIRFQSASNVTQGGQFDLLRCVKTSPFLRRLFPLHSERKVSFTSKFHHHVTMKSALNSHLRFFFFSTSSSLFLFFICLSFRGPDADRKRHLPHHCAGHQ